VLPAVARLAEVPGISEDLARAIIAETGLDMSRFPRRAPGVLGRAVPRSPPVRPPHPGREERPGQHLAARCPGQAANGAARTQTFPGERYHRIARRRGKAKAQVAVARSILVIIWHLLKNPAARYTEFGHGYYQSRLDTGRRQKNHIRQIQAPGFAVSITKAA
jgi:hypothetical protein